MALCPSEYMDSITGIGPSVKVHTTSANSFLSHPTTWNTNSYDYGDVFDAKSSTAINTVDHAIKGKTILAYSDFPSATFNCTAVQAKEKENKIKLELAKKIVAIMMQENCIEFTRTLDSMDGYKFRARCFVVPDSQVQILRTHSVIK